jgi:hypothetical protein
MQPLLCRVDLSAQGQQLLEDDLGRDADELDQLRVRLFIGFIGVRIVAGRPGDFGEIPYDFSDIAVQCLEV